MGMCGAEGNGGTGAKAQWRQMTRRLPSLPSPRHLSPLRAESEAAIRCPFPREEAVTAPRGGPYGEDRAAGQQHGMDTSHVTGGPTPVSQIIIWVSFKSCSEELSGGGDCSPLGVVGCARSRTSLWQLLSTLFGT